MKPKVGTAAFTVPNGRPRSSCRGAATTEHHRFERLQFGGQSSNMGTKFVVILIRRLVATDQYQSFMNDARSRVILLLVYLLIVHHLLLLLLASSGSGEAPLHRLLMLHVRVLILMLVVHNRRIGAHPHSLRRWLMLMMCVVQMANNVAVVAADCADTGIAATAAATKP